MSRKWLLFLFCLSVALPILAPASRQPDAARQRIRHQSLVRGKEYPAVALG